MAAPSHRRSFRAAAARAAAVPVAACLWCVPGSGFSAAAGPAAGQPPEERLPPEDQPPEGLPPEGEPEPESPAGAPSSEGSGALPESDGEDDEGESGDEESGDPDAPESGAPADLAAPPIGILPGRLLASPTPVPGSPVLEIVFGEEGFVVRAAGGQVIAYETDGRGSRWGLPEARAVFIGEYADRVLILDAAGEVTLRRMSDGKWEWGFSTGVPPGDAGSGELGRPPPAVLAAGALYWVSGGALHGFEVHSGVRLLETPLPAGEAAALVSFPPPLASVRLEGVETRLPYRLLVSLGAGGVEMIAPLPQGGGNPRRWRSEAVGPVEGPGLVLWTERLAVFGNAGGVLHALDLETGRPRWRWRLGEGFHHPPLWNRGRLYAATNANSLYCYDASGGGERWRAALPGRPAAPPLRVAGALLVVTRDGALVEFNAETGAQLGGPYDLDTEVVGVVRRRGDGAREDGWRDRRLFLGLRDGRLAIVGPRTGAPGSGRLAR